MAGAVMAIGAAASVRAAIPAPMVIAPHKPIRDLVVRRRVPSATIADAPPAMVIARRAGVMPVLPDRRVVKAYVAVAMPVPRAVREAVRA